MLKNKLDQIKSQDGFTIIEVIIVLVVAAVIMLAVFLVVPALQRQQRNNRRQSDARATLAAAEQYRSENNGGNPSDKLNVTNITNVLKDPGGGDYTYSFVTLTATGDITVAKENIYVYFNAKCTTPGYSTSNKVNLTLATGGTAVLVPQQAVTGSTVSSFCVSG